MMASVQSTEPATTTNTGGIQAVSSADFSSTLISIINTFYTTLSPIVLPAAKLGLLISVLVLLIGGICMSKTIKKVAWCGIVTTIAVLFLFYLGPLIFGYIVTVTKAGIR